MKHLEDVSGWGGPRENSGRPLANPEGKGKMIGARVPQPLIDAIDAWAAEHGMSRSAAIAEAVRRLVS